MSAIFDVVHPAALRYLPQRARNVRFAIVPVVTPVRLAEVSAAEMPQVGTVDRFKAHAHDGHLWTRLPGAETAADLFRETARDIGADPGMLRNAHSWFRTLLSRSPLMAFQEDGIYALDKPPEGLPHTVVRDRSERAAADLVSYLDGHVRLVDGVPFVRLRGPLCRQVEVLHGSVTRASAEAWATSPAGHVTTPSQAMAALPFWERVAVRNRLWVPGATVPAPVDLPEMPETRDDVLHFLNLSPIATIRGQRVCPSDEALRILLPWAEIGMLGGIGIDEADAVLDAVIESCALGEAKYLAHGIAPAPELAFLAKFAHGYVRPRLETAPAPEDDEALLGFGPGTP